MVRTRLKDIAEKTGYSINTVSVALRGGKRVPPKTREIIVTAARQLNYLPNALARSLANKSSRTVGIVLNNLTNPILTVSAGLITQQLEDRGYQAVIVASNGDLEREKRSLISLREHQVAGTMIYPTRQLSVDHIVAMRASNFPVVLLAGTPSPDVDMICVNDHVAAHKLTRHLLALGHRRIAFVDTGPSQGNFRKFGGYAAAHEEIGLEVDRQLVYCPAGTGTVESGYRAAARVMVDEAPPTAMLASTDMAAIGVMSWCRDLGIKVPEDISIAGFDDVEISAYLDVPLTTVRYSARRLAQDAVARLILLMEAGADLPLPETETIEPELVVRASTQAVPSEGSRRALVRSLVKKTRQLA
jgi:LacI family transcriptional regulator